MIYVARCITYELVTRPKEFNLYLTYHEKKKNLIFVVYLENNAWALRYGISRRVFNWWDIQCNTRREIPYLQTTMFYFVYYVNILLARGRLNLQHFQKEDALPFIHGAK